MASRYQQFMEYVAYCKCDINRVLALARAYGYTEYNLNEKAGLENYLKHNRRKRE